jgi:peptidoglycan/xylan/chitin deacetylase (PgdA/CDA1 family)
MTSRRALLGAVASGMALPALAAPALPQCRAGTLYLTIDTGWGREAEAIAAVLRRREVKATLFLADEPDFRGGTTLGPAWAGFWRERAAEGMPSAAIPAGTGISAAMLGRTGCATPPAAPARAARCWTAPGCVPSWQKPIALLRQVAPEAQVLPLWRAPGGRTTPNALRLAAACGLRHQGWSANGFLGDELDSAAHPNKALLAQALRRTQDGEVLLMHWGVRSRRSPSGWCSRMWWQGLQARGFCFATLLKPDAFTFVHDSPRLVA